MPAPKGPPEQTERASSPSGKENKQPLRCVLSITQAPSAAPTADG